MIGHMNRATPLVAFACLLFFISGCSGSGSDQRSEEPPVPPVPPVTSGPERGIRLGLTPFAQDLTDASKQLAWNHVRNHADLVALHFDTVTGLPWQDLEANTVPAPFRDPFDDAAARLNPSDVVYVAINPLNGTRDGVTPNFGGGAFPPEMGAEDFSNPRLQAAFINYARFIVATFNPDYLAIGIEVNMYDLPTISNPDFMDLVMLYKLVYQDLKATNPQLQIFPTFQTEFMHAFDQWDLIASFEPELDRIAISLYPSSQGFVPSNIPVDWISRYSATQSQPLIVSETGYGSEPFSGTFEAPGSNALQADYVTWLLAQAESLNTEFLVWFFPSDTPGLMAPDTLPPEVRANLEFFYAMGLSEEDFTAKPAEAIWDEYLLRQFVP